jgi:hypothetical protein
MLGAHGNVLIAKGAAASNTTLWTETVPVTPNTIYDLSFEATRIDAMGPCYSTLQVFVNGAHLKAITVGQGDWTPLVAVGAESWGSQSSTTATIRIVDTNLSGTGNDLAIDNVNFRQPAGEAEDGGLLCR